MKNRIKRISCFIAAVLLFSLPLRGSGSGPFGVDVVTAATEQATPQPAPSTPKASAQPKAQISYETATEITRFLAFGSYGEMLNYCKRHLISMDMNLRLTVFSKKQKKLLEIFRRKWTYC